MFLKNNNLTLNLKNDKTLHASFLIHSVNHKQSELLMIYSVSAAYSDVWDLFLMLSP